MHCSQTKLKHINQLFLDFKKFKKKNKKRFYLLNCDKQSSRDRDRSRPVKSLFFFYRFSAQFFKVKSHHFSTQLATSYHHFYLSLSLSFFFQFTYISFFQLSFLSGLLSLFASAASVNIIFISEAPKPMCISFVCFLNNNYKKRLQQSKESGIYFLLF